MATSSFISTNPFLGGSLPALPTINKTTAPTAAPVAPNLTKITPIAPSLAGMGTTSNSTTSGVPSANFTIAPPKPTTTSPYASFGTPAVPLTNAGSSTATIPKTPVVPAVTPAAPVKTSSGAVVNPNTGGVMTPATGTSGLSSGFSTTTPSPSIPNMSLITGSGMPNGGISLPGTPSTGTGSGTTTPTPAVPSISSLDPSNNPLVSSPQLEAALKALQDAQAPTSAELAAEQGLANLNTSYQQAYVNAEGQPIPLDFITGQQRRLQESVQSLAAPLQAQATIEQAKRQAAINASNYALQAEQNKLQSLREINTPVTIPLGGTAITPANPNTTLGTGIFGMSSGAIGSTLQTSPEAPYGQPFNPSNALDADTEQYMNSGSMPTSGRFLTPGYSAIVQQRADQLSQQMTGQPFNASQRTSQVSADTQSLQNIQTQTDQANSSLNTIVANGQLLLQGLTAAGLNSTNVPIANAIQQVMAKNLVNPGQAAAFENSLNTLQNEYAKLLMGKGSTTDNARNSAEAALPSTLSASQLAQVIDRIVNEGQNFITSLSQQTQAIQKRLSPYNFNVSPSNFGTSGSTSSSGGGSIYNF